MSFWELYCNEIKPTLCEIDVFIRSVEEDEDTIDATDVAELLSLELDEVKNIMKKNKMHKIDRSGFFTIMERGSSLICRLYAREVECGSPLSYTRGELAYIYGLEIKAVEAACDDLRIKEATQFTIPLIFTKIPVSAVSYHK